MRRRYSIIAVIFCMCALGTCKTQKLAVKNLTITRASGETVKVAAEMALTSDEREHGFMERKKIPDGTGMLFVFENDQILRFWMKNTPHPLSIAYIDSKGEITDILDMTPYSLESIRSSKSVRYALEVPQGFYAANGVAVGDRVTRADVKDLKLSRDFTIAGLVRDGKGQLVDGNTRIMPGDHVVVFCLQGAIHKLDKYFS